MDNTMLFISRLIMSCNSVNRLYGPALINSYIYNYRAGGHAFDHVFSNNTRRPRPRNQDRSNEQICPLYSLPDIVRIRYDRSDSPLKQIINLP
ncbi:hypothetical protein D3C81_2106250 [compost metagenome]